MEGAALLCDSLGVAPVDNKILGFLLWLGKCVVGGSNRTRVTGLRFLLQLAREKVASHTQGRYVTITNLSWEL